MRLATNVWDNLAGGVGGIVYNNDCRDSPYQWGGNLMMTKWDTIQADIADAYTYLDEAEKLDKHNEESLFDEDMISMDEIIEKGLTLNWEDSE